MNRILSSLLLSCLALGALGCASSDDNPSEPGGLPGSSSTLGTYDGLWQTDFDVLDYPVRGLTFSIVADALVQANADSFWDLHQCWRDIQSQFVAQPPAPIQSTRLEVRGLVDGPIRIDEMRIAFTSPTTATGALTVSFNDGGAPCRLEDVPLTFLGSRR